MSEASPAGPESLEAQLIERMGLSLQEYSGCPYRIHECAFFRALALENGETLDRLMVAFKAGGQGGNSRSPDWVPNPSPFDCKTNITDESQDNILHLSVSTFGRANNTGYYAEATPAAVDLRAKYYSLGQHLDQGTGTMISVKTQVEIVRVATGASAKLPESVQTRRKAQWKAVFSGSGGTGCSDYIKIDLPQLAERFAAEMGVDLDYEVGVDDEDGAITDECMNKFKRELKRLLQCSFALDGIDSIVRRISERRLTASAAAGGDAEEEGSDDQMEQSTDGSEHDGEGTDSRVSDTEDYISHSSDDEALGRRPKRQRWSTRRTPPADAPDPGAPESDVDEDPDESAPAQENLLNLGDMRKAYFEQARYGDVGRLEVALEGARNSLELSVVNYTIARMNGRVISKVEYEALTSMAPTKLTRYARNFDTLREAIIDKTPAFIPFKLTGGMFLLQYHYNGELHTSTQGRVDHKMYDGDGGSRVMTYATAAVFRHIILSHHISITTFPLLLCCFAVALLGRPLETMEFFSIRTVRNHIVRLNIIDDYNISKQFKKVFTETKPAYGFKRFWYTATDDAKQKKITHHVVLRSGDYGFELGDGYDSYDPNFHIRPFFDSIGVGPSVTKDNNGNAMRNFDDICQVCRKDYEVQSRHNGNASDNAALKEGVKTCELNMEYLKRKWDVKADELYGEIRASYNHADPFHCCNLAIQHSSEKGLGETEKGDSRQFHHRQFMQTLHDLASVDPQRAQSIAEEIFEECGLPEGHYIIKTVRERIQRWLVNGRNAKHILEGLELELGELEHNFWAEWAKRYLPLSTGWMTQALEEVIMMSGSDEIAIGLQFEAELVDYFEVTYQWHAHPGELSIDRSGFRTMELPHLLFGYIMPWWETAIEEPKKCFPKTFALIDKLQSREEAEKAEAAAAEMDTGDKDDAEDDAAPPDGFEAEDDAEVSLAAIKREQIMFGIQAGYDEISKLYQRTLRAPMIFLGTLDPEVGPSIFRAILALVSEEGVNIDEQTTLYDDDETWTIPSDKPTGWGEFKYEGEGMTRPAEESVWYEFMESDKKLIAKWFKLLGLHRDVVHRDLRRFSHETTAQAKAKRKPESSTRLHDFYEEYPVLFSSYRAMFALMPSATRIVESLHGMMRHSHDAQIPMEFYNAKMRYNVKIDYEMKEKRRVYVRKRRADAGGRKRRSAQHADRKQTQAMVGPQLIKLIETYSVEAINSLPADIKAKISIKEINKRNARTAEKRLTQQKRTRDDGLRRAREQTRGEVDVGGLMNQGRSARTKHTAEHELRSVQQENSAIDKMLTKAYWKNVPADQFKTEAFRVFPTFKSPEVWNVGKTKIMKKSGQVYDIGAHMALIEAIAKKEKPNSLNDTDVSEMEKYDILRMFVKIEQSVVGEQIESASSTAKKRMKAVFQIIGQEIKDARRFKSSATYAGVGDEEEEEDD